VNAAELWGQIISGTVSGVVSGVLLAGTLFMLNWTRNRILESKLRRGFGRCGVGLHDGMFSLIVENRVPIEVRIRTIVLVGRQGHGSFISSTGGQEHRRLFSMLWVTRKVPNELLLALISPRRRMTI
jgi:hypothetical protein